MRTGAARDLAAGRDRVAEHPLDVVGGDVELPERVAHLDRLVDVELLRELELAALVGVLDDRFPDRVEIGTARARDPERLVELDAALQITDVQAVLPDPRAHCCGS